MKRLAPLALTAALAAAALWPAAAHAQNIVQDPGFEMATVTSPGGTTIYTSGKDIGDGVWTVTSGSVGVDKNNPFVLDGQQSLFLTPTLTGGAIEQVLNTTPGQDYTISFIANADSSNSLFVAFNNTLLTATPILVPQLGFNGTGPDTAPFTTYSFNAIASTNSTPLEFIGQAPQGTIELDDISVTPAAAPEPSAFAALSIGLLGLGALALKAKRRSA